jgi:hypothetical protein
MKAKVIIPFRDKITKKNYKKNDIIDVTAERFNEITKVGRFIQAVEVKEPSETKK